MYNGGYGWERRGQEGAFRSWHQYGVHRRDDIRRKRGSYGMTQGSYRQQKYGKHHKQNQSHNCGPSNQGYPPWEIKAAMEVLEYNVVDYRFAALLRRNAISVRGEKSDSAFHPNPKWHGTDEDYKQSFLPYGGTANEQNEVENLNDQTDASKMANSLSNTQHLWELSKEHSTESVVECLYNSASSSTMVSGNSLETDNSRLSAGTKPVPTNENCESQEPVLNQQREIVNKCDYCDHMGSDRNIKAHLTEKKHYSASSYEALKEGDRQTLSFVDIPLKWTEKGVYNEGIGVRCPFCPHEVFENIFLCAAHCDVIHNKPNHYGLSTVVWKGACTINRSFQCDKCNQPFSKLQKLNSHWRQNVDHLPGNLSKYMNIDHVVFFYCCFCSSKHWDFYAMANHVIHQHLKKPAKLSVVVMASKKQVCSIAPVKHPDGNKYILQQLEKLALHAKHIHGAKSQAVKMVKAKIAYHRNFV